MKKIITIIMALALVAVFAVSMVACGNDGSKVNEVEIPALELEQPDYSDLTIPSSFKIGMICLHDESSTYDLNFINAFKAACKELGLSKSQYTIKVNVPEGAQCETVARELAADSCKVIFADSFGHGPYMLKAAKDYPDVQFCHATGTGTTTTDQANFHNAFASIYEGRYLAGIAAGMKLNEMIEAGKFTAAQAKIGYVGAFKYAEVVSGFTSFYLGVKSVCPSVTMEVQFTDSWFDPTAEKNAAETLIARGCKLISQHADSMGAPSACEAAGVPNVSYNGSTIEDCSNTFIISSRIDWTPYVKYIIAQSVKGQAIDDNYVGTLKDGSVVLTALNGDVMAAGTVEAIVAARAKLVAGTLEVFDTANFTVDGDHITEYTADVIDNGEADFWAADTQVIEGGIFKESKFRSAPYFDVKIDGITWLN